MGKPSRSRKTKRTETHRRKPGDSETSARTRRTLTAVLIGVAVVAVGALVVWRINAGRGTPATPTGGAPAKTTPAPAAASRSADFKILVGRWVRTDTPYVIEIRSARDNGTLEAAYYNPRSINVSRAEARVKDGQLGVFVELRDVNYPGSNYTLVYDRENDRLSGIYFQAVQRQNYSVAFTRLRPER